MKTHIRSHTRGFLSHGWTREEFVEILLRIAPYVGFPTYIEGVYGVLKVFEERGPWTRPGPEELRGEAPA